MPYNEADTRAKLITPALHRAGWPEEWIRREQTPGPIQIIGGGGRHGQGRADYVLDALVQGRKLPLALIEAKAEDYPPDEGLEQVKRYARLWSAPFLYSANGHRFVEHDRLTGQTSAPRPMNEFPNWESLRDRYFASLKTEPTAQHGAAILQAAGRDHRYYQHGATRAVLERIAAGQKRALLSLATGTGKTRIAVGILKALVDAQQPLRALFVCDRDELRRQALSALQLGGFGSDAAAASARNPEKNARVVVATYQTLGVTNDSADASYLDRHYGENYFSHIIIDECHRSAWGEWRAVLERNPDAVQIGLTATPRTFDYGDRDPEDLAADDDDLRRDNYHYFGEPIFEYGIAEAMEDGFLAAMQVVRSEIVTEGLVERDQGVGREQIKHGTVIEPVSGGQRVAEDLRERYQPGSIEAALLLPDRVEAMADDLFQRLLNSGGPCQKTLIFCARDHHADAVAAALNNRYAAWAAERGERRADPYAFKCTAGGGRELIADLRGVNSRAFIACTVDLLSTGVDVPGLQNVVFFRYLTSPILFHQMLGRGTRIDPASDKRHFTVYDYTNATRLLDAPLRRRATEPLGESCGTTEPEQPEVLEVSGIRVEIRATEILVSVYREGKLTQMPLTRYREEITQALLAELDDVGDFRDRWIAPDQRRALLQSLPDGGSSAEVLRSVERYEAYDLYDVLAEAAWSQTPRTRVERSERYEALFASAPDQFDCILTNPPFGGKEGADAQTRFAYKTSSTQVLFLQHVIDALKPSGRAGMVVDEGLLFRTNEHAFVQTKRKLLDDCNLHTIVSLAPGVFTSAGSGVKTNLIFFAKGKPTSDIWYYELTPPSGERFTKTAPLTLSHFDRFFELLPARADSEHSWTVPRERIEANNYDLKAVNPHRPDETDTRTPMELLTEIERHGRELDHALTDLRRALG